MLDGLMNNEWFQLAGAIVLGANVITASFPDVWVQKIPVLRTLWPILNWLAANVFHNINTPKGMAAAAEVEKEIAKAKAKVADRDKLPDVLDGL